MKIAPLREQVIFMGKTISQDELGNDSSHLSPLFKRWCSYRPLALTEADGSVTKLSHKKVQFTLRYDKAVLALDTLKTHLHFRGDSYTIEAIDGDSVARDLIYVMASKEDRYDED